MHDNQAIDESIGHVKLITLITMIDLTSDIPQLTLTLAKLRRLGKRPSSSIPNHRCSSNLHLVIFLE